MPYYSQRVVRGKRRGFGALPRLALKESLPLASRTLLAQGTTNPATVIPQVDADTAFSTAFRSSPRPLLRVDWERDAAWATTARLLDYRQENCCEGAAGCTGIYCNFQGWELDVDCTRENMATALFQADRMLRAQQSLRMLLAAPPEALDTSALVVNGGLGARARSAHAIIARNPRAWAEWCVKVMRLVGLVRWSTNVRWWFLGRPEAVTETGRSLVALERGYFQSMALLAGPVVNDLGNRRPQPPIEYSDGFGPLNYCDTAVQSRGGQGSISIPHADPYYLHEQNVVLPTLLAVSNNVAEYDQVGGGFSRLAATCNSWQVRARKVDRPLTPVKVPTNEADFDPAFLLDPQGTGRPRDPMVWPYPGGFPARVAGANTVERLEQWFGMLSTYEPFIDKTAFRGIITAEVLKGQHSILESPTYWKQIPAYYPTPFAQVLYCALVAQDTVSASFGEVIVAALNGWQQEYAKLPPAFRVVPPEQIVQVARSIRQSELDAQAAAIENVGGAVTSIVNAINPVAGVVVGIVVALVALLMRGAQELCIERVESPPCLASPFLRFIDAETALEQGACDFETTGAGGAAAFNTKGQIIEALAANGITPEYWFDALDTLRDESPDIRGDGSGSDQPPATSSFPWLPILGGVAVAGVVSLLLRSRSA